MDSGAFPQVDPMGSASSTAMLTSSVVPQVLEYCTSQLARNAAVVDVEGVRRRDIDALASFGALGITMPTELGGLGADASVQREAAEVLAGSDASTWFCWAQHHTPSRIALATDQRELAESFATGKEFAGVAFAHLRRPGKPNPVATKVESGWLLNGTLDWVTSWDIADRILVIVRGDGEHENEYVHVFIPTTALPGMTIGDPLRLLAMGGTHTRPLTFADTFIADEDVVAIMDRTSWHESDEASSAGVSPAVFGLIRASIAELSVVSIRKTEASAAEIAAALTVEAVALRKSAYDCTEIEEQRRIRAHALDLVERATDAVVNAYAGAAMLEGHVAGRRVREARFMLVQAQTRASRQAWVDRQLSVFL